GVLKLQASIAVLRRFDHLPSRDFERMSSGFFIPAEHDLEIGMIERSGALERLQGADHHHQPALHVICPRSRSPIAGLFWRICGIGIAARPQHGEVLVRALLLKYDIHMLVMTYVIATP